MWFLEVDFTGTDAVFAQVQQVLELLGVWDLLSAVLGLIIVVASTSAVIRWIRT